MLFPKWQHFLHAETKLKVSNVWVLFKILPHIAQERKSLKCSLEIKFMWEKCRVQLTGKAHHCTIPHSPSRKRKKLKILNTNHKLTQILYFLICKLVSLHIFSYVIYLFLKNPPSISKKLVIERHSIKEVSTFLVFPSQAPCNFYHSDVATGTPQY